MARARPFGVFILALCLVACVCAHGVDNKETAKKEAVEAQESAKNALAKVTAENTKAAKFLNDIDTYKQNAEEAAAEAEKEAQGNKEAEAIAQREKEASKELLLLYAEASTAAKNADPGADLLQKKTKMADFAKTAQVEKYHVDGVVSVAKIETLMKTAESEFKLTEKKKEEIAATVEEIKKLVDTSPKGLSQHISGLFLSAEDELKSSLEEVEKAKKAKEGIPARKKGAEDALEKLKAANEVESAKSEAGIAQTAAIKAENDVQEIKEALKSATTFATNALERKSDVEDVISGATKIPGATQDNNKVNPQDATGGPVSGKSAMTVTVPLLMALIACAALQ